MKTKGGKIERSIRAWTQKSFSIFSLPVQRLSHGKPLPLPSKKEDGACERKTGVKTKSKTPSEPDATVLHGRHYFSPCDIKRSLMKEKKGNTTDTSSPKRFASCKCVQQCLQRCRKGRQKYFRINIYMLEYVLGHQQTFFLVCISLWVFFSFDFGGCCAGCTKERSP